MMKFPCLAKLVALLDKSWQRAAYFTLSSAARTIRGYWRRRWILLDGLEDDRNNDDDVDDEEEEEHGEDPRSCTRLQD